MSQETALQHQYRARPGSSLSQRRAEQYGPQVTRLAEVYGRSGLPAQMVEDARPETSPLHDWYTWDDTEAARKQRLHESQLLLNALQVVIVTADSETPPVQAVISVSAKNEDDELERIWMPAAQALTDQDLRERVREKLVARIEALRAEVGVHEDFAAILQDAIQQLAAVAV